MSKLEIAKKIIKENFKDGDCGLFDTPNIMGDTMNCLYNKDGLEILICYNYMYFEVFGLNDDEFDKLCDYYRSLEEGE